jgi:hypothetical protein
MQEINNLIDDGDPTKGISRARGCIWYPAVLYQSPLISGLLEGRSLCRPFDPDFYQAVIRRGT